MQLTAVYQTEYLMLSKAQVCQGTQVPGDSAGIQLSCLTRDLHCCPLYLPASHACGGPLDTHMSGDFSVPEPLNVPTPFCWLLVGITVSCPSQGSASTEQRKQPPQLCLE